MKSFSLWRSCENGKWKVRWECFERQLMLSNTNCSILLPVPVRSTHTTYALKTIMRTMNSTIKRGKYATWKFTT